MGYAEFLAEQERLDKEGRPKQGGGGPFAGMADVLAPAPGAGKSPMPGGPGQPVGPIKAEQPVLSREQMLRNQTNQDFTSGLAKGEELLTSHPDMQMIRSRLEGLSKGYSGQELGAMRGQAQNELSGQRSQYLRQLASRAGKGGIGGARAAAMQGAADKGFSQNKAEMERKMALDNAQLTRSGTKDMSDFIMKQRFGVLGTGAGYAQLMNAPEVQAAQERAAANAAAIAGKSPDRGFLGNLLGSIF